TARADEEYRKARIAPFHLGDDPSGVEPVRIAHAEFVRHACHLVRGHVENYGEDAVADELAARARQEIALPKFRLAVFHAQVDRALASHIEQRHCLGLALAHVGDEERERHPGPRREGHDLLPKRGLAEGEQPQKTQPAQTRFARSAASPVYFAGVSASRRFFASSGIGRLFTNAASSRRSRRLPRLIALSLS